ncbi:4-(cytidine 5'-diphospho)-2-C-methyl-D-erythritol kinase [Helicobacter sp. MIT 14-3879]|uniref:4-(cytidine 5'-diphospho)-2-C-methyl-D-erythritol kinase n=1 Tax=Helicobacter sp. MIT 14-3879 TaxID=2040649 RepID=UPI000E1F41AA|nr:4-(cytidine 5'-diphospho)-2-C-methyl-D-erythritol kinase [Helicobacter sp. MIT 14-3879]RDU63559.1 4-(cytidine 5'-diphospho)-2-C-methyl-D-erythritol kinase [Helicobacter sp. MIT 14-3879]
MQYFYISYPKVNIFFKILGILPNGYCDIASRYMRVRGKLFDNICITDSLFFNIKGNFDCKIEDNTIFRAKEVLKTKIANDNISKKLELFSIEVEKKIPSFAGLGGGSSNAATYLLAMNEILELNLSKNQLASIAALVGSDVSFFIYELDFANVFGIGDRVEEFKEKYFNLDIITPPIKCSTKAVFDEFKKMPNFSIANMLELDSILLLKKFNLELLNDLYVPALRLYPKLKEYAKDGYFFSGSGSSFFKILDKG